MASAMRKMAVYLGLVEDDHRYQDKYDAYERVRRLRRQADRLDGHGRSRRAARLVRRYHGAPRAASDGARADD